MGLALALGLIGLGCSHPCLTFARPVLCFCNLPAPGAAGLGMEMGANKCGRKPLCPCVFVLSRSSGADPGLGGVDPWVPALSPLLHPPAPAGEDVMVLWAGCSPTSSLAGALPTWQSSPDPAGDLRHRLRFPGAGITLRPEGSQPHP